MKPRRTTSTVLTKPGADPKTLLADLRGLILVARQTVARGVNASLVVLYWQIGRRIRKEILRDKRAKYGKRIFYALSRELTLEFGSGFSQANLFQMVRFAEVFPDSKILHALCAELSWSRFRRLIYLDDPLQRDFYAEMCRIEQWTTRTWENGVSRSATQNNKPWIALLGFRDRASVWSAASSSAAFPRAPLLAGETAHRNCARVSQSGAGRRRTPNASRPGGPIAHPRTLLAGGRVLQPHHGFTCSL
jgi:hypothetical protein